MNRQMLFLSMLLVFLFPWPWPDMLDESLPLGGWADAWIKPPPVEGWASQYARGVMERVIRYRQAQGQLSLNLSGYEGAVARPECADIGDAVWLRVEGGQWERFIVADCGCPIGKKWMEDNGILVEVDYQTALRWETIGRIIKVEMMQ